LEIDFQKPVETELKRPVLLFTHWVYVLRSVFLTSEPSWIKASESIRRLGPSQPRRKSGFNLPNHLNPFTPGTGPTGGTAFGGSQGYNAPNFGQITTDISGNGGLLQGDYRVIQLAMKFMF
jgi:hypothetical protein